MEQWRGKCFGKMHIHGISQSELAEEIGIRRDYLCKVLNGKENPKGARERIEEAIKKIIDRRKK